MALLQGNFLIASPKMDDPNFHRTVILMLEHDDEGSMGLILNRPLSLNIDEAWNRISELPCHHEGPVYQGGPCPGPLMVVHGEADIGGMTVMPGLYMSSESPEIERLMRQPLTQVRFVIGYAGWGPGQLEDEMQWGVWRTVAGQARMCFDDADSMWMNMLRHIDPTLAMLEAKPHIRPSDPTMN